MKAVAAVTAAAAAVGVEKEVVVVAARAVETCGVKIGVGDKEKMLRATGVRGE